MITRPVFTRTMNVGWRNSRHTSLCLDTATTCRGREVVIAITDGTLDFGPWEQVFYGEFDGRRRKRVLIKIIGQ